MKLRIRPQAQTARVITQAFCTFPYTKVRVVSPASRAGVMLAQIVSVCCVTVAVASFTILCWKVGREVVGPAGASTQVSLESREVWLLVCALGASLGKLIHTFSDAAGEYQPELVVATDSDFVPAEFMPE